MTTRSKRRQTRRLTLLANALAAGLLAMTAAPAAAATTAAPDGGAQVARPLPWDSHAGTHGFHDGG
jgi:hypothetical protein